MSFNGGSTSETCALVSVRDRLYAYPKQQNVLVLVLFVFESEKIVCSRKRDLSVESPFGKEEEWLVGAQHHPVGWKIIETETFHSQT